MFGMVCVNQPWATLWPGSLVKIPCVGPKGESAKFTTHEANLSIWKPFSVSLLQLVSMDWQPVSIGKVSNREIRLNPNSGGDLPSSQLTEADQGRARYSGLQPAATSIHWYPGQFEALDGPLPVSVQGVAPQKDSSARPIDRN